MIRPDAKRIERVRDLAANGLTSGMIARELGLTRSTVMGIVFRNGIHLGGSKVPEEVASLSYQKHLAGIFLRRAEKRLAAAQAAFEKAKRSYEALSN